MAMSTNHTHAFINVRDSLMVSIDSSTVEQLSFGKTLSTNYTGNEFDYHTVEGEAQNILLRAINWFLNGLQNIFGIETDPNFREVIEQILLVLLVIGVVYFMVRILVGKNAVSFFSKKNTVVAPLLTTEEHIEKVNLTALIEEAINNKDYRLVIRYSHLKILQELSQHHLIDYHFEKTNTDYQEELTDPELQQQFGKVSYLYEYIWYGAFELDQHSYQSAMQSFEKLTTKISGIG